MAKTVVITGSSRGIGRALAEHYEKAGWKVIATARNVDALSFLGSSSSTTKHALDTASEASIAAFANSLADTPVNLLINNAGIFEKGEQKNALVDQFVTNAVGPLLLAKALYRNLKAGSTPGNPAVVANISSGMGSIGDNTSGGYYGYRASKSALNSFMKTLSLEWKPENISVLIFCPGWVQTDMGGAGAAITTTQSVTGLSGLIDKAFGDLGMTGTYLRYNGDKIECCAMSTSSRLILPVDLIINANLSASSFDSKSPECVGGRCRVSSVQNAGVGQSGNDRVFWQSEVDPSCANQWIQAQFTEQSTVSYFQIQYDNHPAFIDFQITLNPLTTIPIDAKSISSCTSANVTNTDITSFLTTCILHKPVDSVTGLKVTWQLLPTNGTCQLNVDEIIVMGFPGVPITEPNGTLSLSTGAVIGITLGSVLVFILLLIQLPCCILLVRSLRVYKHWKHKNDESDDEEEGGTKHDSVVEEETEEGTVVEGRHGRVLNGKYGKFVTESVLSARLPRIDKDGERHGPKIAASVGVEGTLHKKVNNGEKKAGNATTGTEKAAVDDLD